MLFTLKPTMRHLALALPVLLTALPAAIGADQDKLGPVLPPPSLYDLPPTGQPASAAPEPSLSAPATLAPAPSVPVPPTVAPAPPPPTVKAAEPVKATSSVTPEPAAATEPRQPWYRRLFSWLPWKSSAKPAAQKTPAQPQVTAVARDVTGSSSQSTGRGYYAFDASSRSIRSGMTGECVRMGLWTPETANTDCHPSLVASRPVPAKAAPAVAVTPPPRQAPAVAVTPPPRQAPAASTVTVAMIQPPRAPSAGSAPAPIPVREYAPKVEPVEVIPLPPRPPAASEERPLELEHAQNAEEEPITALAAETQFMPEPEFDKLSLSASGLFALSSKKIKPSGQQALDEMVEQLKGMPYDSVLIVGHTDPTGSKAINDKLSKQRAESVKQYLVSKGVDPKRIKTEGKGGAEPLAKTQNCDSLPRTEKIACYAPDRRVEIEVVGGTPHT
jgi:outer membrane protein OmpA-like peptidoglycan-associated protein